MSKESSVNGSVNSICTYPDDYVKVERKSICYPDQIRSDATHLGIQVRASKEHDIENVDGCSVRTAGGAKLTTLSSTAWCDYYFRTCQEDEVPQAFVKQSIKVAFVRMINVRIESTYLRKK